MGVLLIGQKRMTCLQSMQEMVLNTKRQRFCENCQNQYCDDTRQTKNQQNCIVTIPSQYLNHIGSDSWCLVNTRQYQYTILSQYKRFCMSKIAGVNAALISYILTFRKIVSSKKKTRTLSVIKKIMCQFHIWV